MSYLIILPRAVDFGTASVIPAAERGTVTVTLGTRSAVVPTARAYTLIGQAGLPGITERPGTPAWRWQIRQVASAVLGDWQ